MLAQEVHRKGRWRRRIGLPDADAFYEMTVEINTKELKPTIACPHQVDNTKTIDEIGEVKVDQVFLGTSCNGRLEGFFSF